MCQYFCIAQSFNTPLDFARGYAGVVPRLNQVTESEFDNHFGVYNMVLKLLVLFRGGVMHEPGYTTASRKTFVGNYFVAFDE